MRIRGVIVLLATLVVVLGALASFSLVLTGKVIEAEEGVSSSVAEPLIDESPPVLFEPTLSEISSFKVRFSKQSGILLEWNVSSDASHVVIWRAYSSEGPWFIRKVISTNTLVPRSFYLDRDLMTSTRYYYRMQAINGQELSPFTETRSLYVMYTGDGVETSVSEPDPRYGSPEFWSEYIGECGSSKSVACVSRDREGTCIQTSPTYGGECERRLKLYNEFRIGEICRMHPLSALRLGCSSLSPRTFSTSGGSGSGGGSGEGNQNDDCFTAEGERNIETDVIECQPQQPPQPLTPPSPNDPSGPGGGDNGGGGGGSGNNPTRDYSCHDATARRLIEEGRLPWTPCPKKNETEKNETNQTELNETRSISELLDLWEVEYWENIDKIHSNDNTTLEEKQKESLIAYREWIDKSSNTAIGNRTALYLEGLAYEKLGTELEKQGRLEEAKKAYENAWKACENAAAGFSIKSETNEYAARACAARNAFRHAALFGPEGGVLDDKYNSRERAEKLYEELANEIEAIEDPELKEKLLPIALEAYVGLAQSKMLGGDIRAADDAIEQLERLAPDHAVTKKVRSIFERALINFIMKTLENSESNANDLLSQKLRTDDGMLSLIAQTGLIDAWDGAQATAADLRNALLGEELGNTLESLLPLGSVGMSKSDLEIITTAVAQENFKLTDQEIGFSFMKLALEDGRALKELQGLSVEQISDVFGLDLVACSEEECASAMKRAEYIHNKLQNAFENPDVQQYLNDIDGHAFQFENNENYINGDLLAELSGGASSSDSSSDLYFKNVNKLTNDMTSIQGVTLGFGPFATLGKLSVSIGAGSRTFTLVGMAEHSLASVVLGSGGSVTSALYKTTKSLFTSIDDSAVLTQSVLAVERTHLLTNEIARQSPSAVKEFFSEVAEEVVPEAIGMGANVVAPGSGAIVELIGTAVELAPLTHVGGKARNAGEAVGMAVTSGNSNNRKLGVDFVKTEFFDNEQRKLVTKYVPEFETETRKLDDAVIFYNSENGKTLGKSTRTAFTIHGDPIPIIEFNNQQAFNQYTQNLQTAQNGMYQLRDGSYVIPYVKGNLPSVLPDAKANTLLLKGGKKGDSLMMIGEPVDDASLSFISTGLIEEDTRLYSRSEVENVYLYLPPIDSRFGIVGVTPNSLFVQKANAEIDALVEAGVIKVQSPRGVKRDTTARRLILTGCAVGCSISGKLSRLAEIEDPWQGLVFETSVLPSYYHGSGSQSLLGVLNPSSPGLKSYQSLTSEGYVPLTGELHDGILNGAGNFISAVDLEDVKAAIQYSKGGVGQHIVRYTFEGNILTLGSAYPRELTELRERLPLLEERAKATLAVYNSYAECYGEVCHGVTLGATYERVAIEAKNPALFSKVNDAYIEYRRSLRDLNQAKDRIEYLKRETSNLWGQRANEMAKLYENLPDTLKKVVTEPFPIVYGLDYTGATEKIDSDISGEVGISQTISPENLVIYVPRERVADVKELVKHLGIPLRDVKTLEALEVQALSATEKDIMKRATVILAPSVYNPSITSFKELLITQIEPTLSLAASSSEGSVNDKIAALRALDDLEKTMDRYDYSSMNDLSDLRVVDTTFATIENLRAKILADVEQTGHLTSEQYAAAAKTLKDHGLYPRDLMFMSSDTAIKTEEIRDVAESVWERRGKNLYPFEKEKIAGVTIYFIDNPKKSDYPDSVEVFRNTYHYNDQFLGAHVTHFPISDSGKSIPKRAIVINLAAIDKSRIPLVSPEKLTESIIYHEFGHNQFSRLPDRYRKELLHGIKSDPRFEQWAALAIKAGVDPSKKFTDRDFIAEELIIMATEEDYKLRNFGMSTVHSALEKSGVGITYKYTGTYREVFEAVETLKENILKSQPDLTKDFIQLVEIDGKESLITPYGTLPPQDAQGLSLRTWFDPSTSVVKLGYGDRGVDFVELMKGSPNVKNAFVETFKHDLIDAEGKFITPHDIAASSPEDISVLEAIAADASHPHGLTMKFDALRHLEFAETSGVVPTTPTRSFYARTKLMEQLAPQRALLSQEQQKLLDEAKEKSERSLTVLQELPLSLIETPSSDLFPVRKIDPSDLRETVGSTRVNKDTIDMIFTHQYDQTKPKIRAAKGIAYKDNGGTIHVRFWKTGEERVDIGVHHRDALSDLIQQEAKGLENIALARDDIALLELAEEKKLKALDISQNRRHETYSEDVLRQSQGFQLIRGTDGKILFLDVDSSITSAQTSQKILLDSSTMSQLISEIHESISPEFRGYGAIRVKGLGEMNFNEPLNVPVRVVELQ